MGKRRPIFSPHCCFLALVVGLVAGIFISQFMMFATAHMFNTALDSFKFIFSQTALIQTVIYFVVMFVVALIPFAAAVAFIALTAPQLSDFQNDLLLNASLQEQSAMTLTRKHADTSQASNYNVVEGVTYIGDSVSLRARSYLQDALPDAQIDASVSRNVAMGVDLLQSAIDNNTLYQDVVVALGTNPVGGSDAVDKIVDILPRVTSK